MWFVVIGVTAIFKPPPYSSLLYLMFWAWTAIRPQSALFHKRIYYPVRRKFTLGFGPQLIRSLKKIRDVYRLCLFSALIIFKPLLHVFVILCVTVQLKPCQQQTRRVLLVNTKEEHLPTDYCINSLYCSKLLLHLNYPL